MKITIVGTGYVGLVTGVCLAEVGHEVTCVDIDENKIRTLKDARSPIFEPGLEKFIKNNLANERLFFTSNLAQTLTDAETVFIAVGTPEEEDGSADLSHVLAVARGLGQSLYKDMTIVVKSTVPVGTCDEVEKVVLAELAKRKKNIQINVISNPEFLKEGAAIDDFMKPDRIIVGLKNETGRKVMEEIYKPFILDDPGKLFMIDRRSSELTKYGANAMLATRISFMNEMARLCEKVGANIDDVRRGMGTDPRIGKKFLYAGPGYGGSCFPKDVMALLNSGKKNGVEFLVLNAVEKANTAQATYVSNMVVDYFKDLKNKKIALWGLAFKPGTDDVRCSPSLKIVNQLLQKGASVVGHDPEAAKNFAKILGSHDRMTYATTAIEALNGADALVLVTEWSQYRRPNWDKITKEMQQKVVFDFRNQYDAERMKALGIYYRCIGRPDSSQVK